MADSSGVHYVPIRCHFCGAPAPDDECAIGAVAFMCPNCNAAGKNLPIPAPKESKPDA